MDKKNQKSYEDIIHTPNPISLKHPRMSLYERAAQFSPFSALTGHEAAIHETARFTERRLEADEDRKEQLDGKIQWLLENADKPRPIKITYFKADQKKAGGAYISYTGMLEKINTITRTLVMQDKTEIPAEDVWELEM